MNDTMVAGLPLGEWMKQVEVVPGGFAVEHPDLRDVVGLFFAVQDSRIVFVGQGTETGKGRGLYKRLMDFLRDGESGRKHFGGRMIYASRHKLELRVLITGDDKRSGGLAKQLRKAMIALHRPDWNKAKRRSPKLRLIAAAPPSVETNIRTKAA